MFQVRCKGRVEDFSTTNSSRKTKRNIIFHRIIFYGGSLSRSDEGGFGRARQNSRAQPDSRAAAKPTEVGGADSEAKDD